MTTDGTAQARVSHRPSTGFTAWAPTHVVVGLTAAASVVAILNASVLDGLTRQVELLRGGQWWRVGTPVLVQPHGWFPLGFLLSGVVVLLPRVAQTLGPRRSLVVYVVGGVGSLVILTPLQPWDRSGGSSDAVAALVGAWTVLRMAGMPDPDQPRLGGPSRWSRHLGDLYAVFFVCYLASLATAGPVAAPLLGDLAVSPRGSAGGRWDRARRGGRGERL